MDYQAFSEEISGMVRPQSFPLGIKLLKETEELPQGSVRPSKYGIRISLCQWITMARRWGRILGAVAEDINCTPCLAALGLKKLESSLHLCEYFLGMGYVPSIELAEIAIKKTQSPASGRNQGNGHFPAQSRDCGT